MLASSIAKISTAILSSKTSHNSAGENSCFLFTTSISFCAILQSAQFKRQSLRHNRCSRFTQVYNFLWSSLAPLLIFVHQVSLIENNVHSISFCRYKCQAKNSHGQSASLIIKLEPEPVPDSAPRISLPLILLVVSPLMMNFISKRLLSI